MPENFSDHILIGENFDNAELFAKGFLKFNSLK